MVDFNLVLELMAVLATLVYMVLLVNENFAGDKSDNESVALNTEPSVHAPYMRSNYVKKSLLGQYVYPRF